MMEECIEEIGVAVGDKETVTLITNAPENEVTNGETCNGDKDITSEIDNIDENNDEQTSTIGSNSDQVEHQDDENKLTAIILGGNEETSNEDENINNNNNETSDGLSASDLERQNAELLDRKNIN